MDDTATLDTSTAGAPITQGDLDGSGHHDADRTKPWVTQAIKQAVPLPVAAMLWGAAEAAHATADVWPWGVPVTVAVYVVGAIAAWTSWAKNHPENRAQRRRWVRTVIASSGTWLLWAALTGPGQWAGLLLVAGGAATMLPYWTRNSPWQPDTIYATPNDGGDDPEEDMEVPDAPVLEVVEHRTANQLHWDTVVAGPHGTPGLAGTRLVDPDITDGYEEYTIQLVAGKQTSLAATTNVRNIASAYGRSITTIAVMPHPSGVENKAKIRFAKDNPLAKTFWWPGPEQALDLRGGNIRAIFGYHGDGSPVWWEFYRNGWGAKGGGVFGDTGSGKSELLRSLITSAAYSGLILPVVGCPQGGASFPMWIEHSDWSAPTADEILLQARGLRRAHATRSMINRLMKRELHVPTPDEPMLLWTIDELHKMREHPDAAEFYQILDLIEREGRKTAVRALVADQDMSVPATFFNIGTIRRSLLAAQVVTLRMGAQLDAQVGSALLVNPRALPKEFPDGTPTSGLGALVGDAETMRVGRLRDAWALAKNAPRLTIEKAVANAIGPDYLDRHARGLRQDGEAAAEIFEVDPELFAQIVADKPELAAAAEAARLEKIARTFQLTGDETTHLRDLARPTDPLAPRIVMPAVPRCQVTPLRPVPAATWTCLERVEELLKNGVTRFGEIEAAAKRPDGKTYSETAIREALKELISQGRAEDGGHAHYRFRAA
jgi:hypothetical protein